MVLYRPDTRHVELCQFGNTICRELFTKLEKIFESEGRTESVFWSATQAGKSEEIQAVSVYLTKQSISDCNYFSHGSPLLTLIIMASRNNLTGKNTCHYHHHPSVSAPNFLLS